MRDRRDESLIHVGSRGTVTYRRTGDTNVKIVVREICVRQQDGRLYAKCALVVDPDGETRWFLLDEITPTEETE